MKNLLSHLKTYYLNYIILLDSKSILDVDKEYFINVLNKKEKDLTISLKYLSLMLNEHYGKHALLEHHIHP